MVAETKELQSLGAASKVLKFNDLFTCQGDPSDEAIEDTHKESLTNPGLSATKEEEPREV